MFPHAFTYALDRIPTATLVKISIWMACPIVLLMWMCVADRRVDARRGAQPRHPVGGAQPSTQISPPQGRSARA